MSKLPREKGKDIVTKSQSIGRRFQLVYNRSVDSVLQRRERLRPVQNTLKTLRISAMGGGQAVVEEEGRWYRSESSHFRHQRKQESQKTSYNQPARQTCQFRRAQYKFDDSPGPLCWRPGPRDAASGRMVYAWVCCRGRRLDCDQSTLGTQP